jgi:hypothetical protein
MTRAPPGLAHERRRIVHFAVTAHPTAEWTAHQLREAFPWETAPRYLLRDRDRIFGHKLVNQVKAMGMQQVLSAPRSPWQKGLHRAADWQHPPAVFGSLHRIQPTHFEAPSFGLRVLLPRNPNALSPAEGLS